MSNLLQNITGKRILAIVLAILAAFAITVKVTTDGETTTVTVTVQTPQGQSVVTAPVGAVDAISESAADTDHTNLGVLPSLCPLGVTPGTTVNGRACVSGTDAREGEKQVDRQVLANPLPTVNPLASPSIPGCRTQFLTRNYSSRNGVRPIIIVWHITVSPDRGRAGVQAIVVYFGQAGPGVSSHFVVAGATDACSYIVPTSQKAWTQTGFNSRAISIEVTGTTTQGYYVKGPGRTRFVDLNARLARSWGIPLRRGAISGCTVTRSGFVDHTQLGACGGGHSDINPYRGQIPGLIDSIQHRYRALYSSPTAGLNRKQAKWCRSLKILRAQFRDNRTTVERRVRARKLINLLGDNAESCR